MLNINSKFERSVLVTKEKIDEYGFVIPGADDPRWATLKDPKRSRFRRFSIGVGRGNYLCKNLCRHIRKTDSRQVSFRATGYYYCCTCEIAMKCNRCRCCGRMGRAEPRGRHRRLTSPYIKFIE